MKTAIVTGANGFIGSHIVPRLLEQGWSVHALGRGTGTTPWSERVSAALAGVANSKPGRGRLACHEMDLTTEAAQVASRVGLDSPSSQTTLVHCAGDTRFRPSNPDVQRRINVDAAIGLIAALKGRIDKVIHVSTAYVAGDRTGLILEGELDRGQGFHNSYEKSKLDAEMAVSALCWERGIPLVIVRPSIIINDRRNGRASTFTHLNALVEVVSRIQEHYGIADGQVVSRTIRLAADPDARPNLAPVDAIIPPLLTLVESPAAVGKVFHLCHPRPQSNAEVVDLISEAFGVKGKLSLEFVSHIPRPMSRTEEMILRSLKVYAPYLNSLCEFDLRNSRSIVRDYDSHFTGLDIPYLQRVIGFQRSNRR